MNLLKTIPSLSLQIERKGESTRVELLYDAAVYEVLGRRIDIYKSLADLKLRAHDEVGEVDHDTYAIFGGGVAFIYLEYARSAGSGV